MLCNTHDFDIVSLDAYMDRVALIDSLPSSGVQQWAEEELDIPGSMFGELVDTFPLNPEIIKDNDRVIRRKLVLFCVELLKAKAAIKVGLTEKAWWHWSLACFYQGQAEGYYLLTKPAEDKKRSGQKGGDAKEAKRRKAVLDSCITHLKKERPPSGWETPDAAIKAVLHKVEAHLGKKCEGIDVFVLLNGWLNGDPSVQKAGGFKMECIKG